MSRRPSRAPRPATARLPLLAATLCGYCDQPLVLQPAGDWACPPCRQLMASTVAGPTYPDVLAQFSRFQRLAAAVTARRTA